MSIISWLSRIKYCFMLIALLATSIIILSCKKNKVDKTSNNNHGSVSGEIITVDSTRIKDSIRIADSLKIVDSLRIIESIRIMDSIRIADSIARLDRVFHVGSGSGYLTIDGNNFSYNGNPYTFKNGDSIFIKGGSYSGMTIQNVSVSTDGERVTFVTDGTVLFDGRKQLNLSNLNNVTVSGAGTSIGDRGFVFINNSFRAVVLSGSVNNFTFQNAYFKNISDYVIIYNGLDEIFYNGSQASYMTNLAFLNIDAEQIGPLIQFNGDITPSSYKGLISGLEIANITCINSPGPGTVVYVGCVENANIHDNYISNVNTQLENHNGVFFIHGSGKFYNNRITNHQGNALRAWIFGFDDSSKMEIYNNIVYNSRKYGAFEIQVPQYMRSSSVFLAVNSFVFNNTVGRMNTDKMTFPGRLLDVYNTYGTLEVYNNLLFENNDSQILNNMSDTKIVRNENNIYVDLPADAIENLNTFKSKVVGVGFQ